MSDDSFIREVNEEIRQERAKALWGRYGPILIGAAVLLVLATGAYQLYSYFQGKKADSLSETYIAALDLANKGSFNEALARLNDVEASGFGGYPTLAELRKASILAEQNKLQDAVAQFDAIAANSATPAILKKVAQIRAAYILVDIASYDDVAKRVNFYANELDPMRMSAWEALGLAAWKANNIDEAKKNFTNIVEKGVPNTDISYRAGLMLSLINSNVTTKKD